LHQAQKATQEGWLTSLLLENCKADMVQCNCHEKLSTQKADLKAKRQKVAVLDRVPTPELIPNTTPSSQSVSSFSQSPLSQLDNVLFGDDINTALASLSDLYSYGPSDAQLPVDTVFQEYVPKEVSTMRHRPVSAPRSSVLPGASSLTMAPAQGVEVNGPSQIRLPSGLPSVSNTAVESAKKRTVRRGATDIQGPSLAVVSDMRGGNEPSPHTSEHGALAGASPGLPKSRLIVQSPAPSLPVLPGASSSSVSRPTPIQTQAPLAGLVGPVGPAGPSRQVLPTAVSETLETVHSANVRFQDVYSAAVMQQSPSDFAASLFATEWVSRLSTTMAMQTLQVILACRPQLFQFLSAQAMSSGSYNTPALPFFSELNPVRTVSAGLIGCA
jgi:hypothetical protein